MRTFYQAVCRGCRGNAAGADDSCLLVETNTREDAAEVALRHFEATGHTVCIITVQVDEFASCSACAGPRG